MSLDFAKMHGAGNDFVVVVGAPPPSPTDGRRVRALADRRRGIGADGVLFLERGADDEHVLRMHFYNSDGGRARLCLNGARCVALRAVELGWAEGAFHFATDAGTLEAEVLEREGRRGRVRLRLPAPQAAARPTDLPAGSVGERGFFVDTGDPHLVVEVEREVVERVDVGPECRPLRWSREIHPEGANVHLVHRDGERWSIRSYERGVEGETLACGSGCVSAVAALEPTASEVVLRTVGDDELIIRPGPQSWELEGPAERVFEASWSGHV